MPDRLILTLPFPTEPAGQNARKHWSKRFKETKSSRTATAMEVQRAANGRQWPAATMVIRLFFPSRRRTDVLNVIESIKPDVDGIVDAKLIPDDDWTHLRPTIDPPVLDRDNPRIELELEEALRI